MKRKQMWILGLPTLVIISFVGLMGWREWKSTQQARPDYEYPEKFLGRGQELSQT
jgi:hypothetical protein